MTYLPLGMVMGGLIFSLIAVLPRYGKYATTARHCTTLALAGVFPTMLLGYLDWQHYDGGRLLFPIQMKLILAATLTFLLALAVLLYWKLHARDKRIRGEAEPRMPYRQDPLSEKRVQRIADWVRQGAKP